MFCKSPETYRKVSPNAPFGCGQCLPCRINRARIWQHRIMLEAKYHTSSIFLTITYDDEHLPRDHYVHTFKASKSLPKRTVVYSPFSVRPDHHRKFMDDLRWHSREHLDIKIRMFGVGEYGDRSQRPHYHYALFGFPRCYGGARYVGRVFVPCRCDTCTFLTRIWGKGHVFVGDLTLDSARYIAGYVTKKLTNDKSQFNCDILQGRFPEFSRQSSKPGIAASAVDEMVLHLTTYGKLTQDEMPTALLHGSKLLPLGRYLSDKLYEKMGIQFADGEKLRLYEESVREMLSDPEIPALVAKIWNRGYGSPALAMKALNEGRVLNLEAQRQMFFKEKCL